MSNTPAPTPISRRTKVIGITAGIVVLAIVLFGGFSSFYTDFLWFKQLGFANVITTEWLTKVVMFLIGFVGAAVPLWAAIVIAFRSRPTYVRLSGQAEHYQALFEPLRKLVTWGLPAVIGIGAGIVATAQWSSVLLMLNGDTVGKRDPQFHMDYGFYMFTLPVLRQVLAFASAIVLIAGIIGLVFNYLYGSIRILERDFVMAKAARVQLAVTAAIYLLLQAVSIWLDRYATMTQSSKLFVGPGFTVSNAVIPGLAILSGIAAVVAVLCIIAAIIGRWRLPLVGVALFIVASIVIGVAYPWSVQKFQVEPNEKVKESSYLAKNIQATREAFGLDKVKVENYKATVDTNAGALRNDADTTAQLRIMDPTIVGSAFSQLQVIKGYYQFKDTLNVDRYKINGKTQDTIIAVRELNADKLSNSWYNNTFVYTHGYGVAAAYGNERTDDGQPKFMEGNIPASGLLSPYRAQVYFGINSPEYSIVGGTKSHVEFDYPGGANNDQQTYTTFTGSGGPNIGSWPRRLMYALKFGSEQILFSSNVNAKSQILYDRNPIDRVNKVAPYLTTDKEAYPAIINKKLVWVIDGYTTNSNYPYANGDNSGEFGTDVNYVRNSVKATVDAYDGSVNLYVWDATDPILKAWQKVYPSSVQPVSKMSAQLLDHVRYPTDLFKAQRSLYGTYHVTDSGAFFSNEDAWTTPKNPQTASTSNALQPPYYLSMRLPGQQASAFSLYSTYIPKQQEGQVQRNVLSGYLAANADAGTGKDGVVSKDYGKLTLLRLPGDSTVPAPGQVQNAFRTEPSVTTQINLWNQGGNSRAVFGNLLTLPMGGGMLYVQPLYVESKSDDSYPLLRKVLVAFGDKIAFEDSLNDALNKLFGGSSGAQAGDTNAQTSNGGTSNGDSGKPSDTPNNGDKGGKSAALNNALEDARKAMIARQDALKQSDWAAYGKADEALEDALNRALNAEGD